MGNENGTPSRNPVNVSLVNWNIWMALQRRATPNGVYDFQLILQKRLKYVLLVFMGTGVCLS